MLAVHQDLAIQTKSQNTILINQQEALTTLADKSIMQTDLATVLETSRPFYKWQHMKVLEKVKKEQAEKQAEQAEKKKVKEDKERKKREQAESKRKEIENEELEEYSEDGDKEVEEGALCGLIAWTCRSDESSYRLVRAVLGHGCSTRGRTGLSKQLTGGIICSDSRVRPLVGQPGPTSCWTALSKKCLDMPVWRLVGPACPIN
ncbi:hypothetical protein PSTG_10132 [Puccinia striiformis f. sp. tritici PST-78]|uniref:No apical meristem-associated C-terminal domain-containing protein n=1 Tax=Puccinia striiformis f. sp. tritici PST-78 TaxID=1165861 RepID=A0A0L0VC73_9BASI|nr:hypothetical protein PSTG_10132 [Puccinia striiformis f. sp. tritici PST-78]